MTAERIPAAVAIRVPLKAYLASDGKTPATGKTIAITISKNGAAYGNPNAGATNATEIGSGSYYVDLDTTDTGTAGPLMVLGTNVDINQIDTIYNVVNANNAGFAGVPNAVAGASGGLLISGSNSGTTTLGALTVSGATTLTGNVSMAAGLNITQSSSNTTALVVTGNGTGAGATFTSGSGSSGNGINFVAASTNGNGINAAGTGNQRGAVFTGGSTGNGVLIQGGSSSGTALACTAQGTESGISLTGSGSGHGLNATAGATGNGINVVGGGTSGNGINVTTTNGHGVNLAPVGTDKHGLLATGGNGGTSDGIKAVAGTGGTPIRGTITGNLVGVIDGVSATGAATFFTVDSGQTSGTAVDGSVVKEIIDGSGGGSAADVWDYALGDATVSGSVGEAVNDIVAKTDQLTFTVAGQVDANAKSMNDEEIFGTGTSGDLWRGTL